MRATLAGSVASRRISYLAGLPLGTAQKPQPRVQRSPRIRNVAAPRWKHSWMLGQRADSHTVWRFRSRRPRLTRLSDSKSVRLLRAHAGSRGRGAAPSCTREWSTLLHQDRMDAGVFQFRFGAAQRLLIVVRPDQHADQVVGAGLQRRREALVLHGLTHGVGGSLAGGCENLPIRPGRRVDWWCGGRRGAGGWRACRRRRRG